MASGSSLSEGWTAEPKPVLWASSAVGAWAWETSWSPWASSSTHTALGWAWQIAASGPAVLTPLPVWVPYSHRECSAAAANGVLGLGAGLGGSLPSVLPFTILRWEKLTHFGRVFFFFSGTYKFSTLLCIPSSPAQIDHLFPNSGYRQAIVLFHMGSVIPLSSNPALFF